MINYIILIFNIFIIGISIQQGNFHSKSNFYSKMIHTSTIQFIKIFPYIGFIPVMVYSLSVINS